MVHVSIKDGALNGKQWAWLSMAAKTSDDAQGSGMDMSGAAASAEKQTTREVLKQMVKSTGQRSLYVTHLSASLLLHRLLRAEKAALALSCRLWLRSA